ARLPEEEGPFALRQHLLAMDDPYGSRALLDGDRVSFGHNRNSTRGLPVLPAYGDRMRICVFLSAADLDDRYTRPAREFAELIGKGGHTLVWGGSDVGLMKVVADG